MIIDMGEMSAPDAYFTMTQVFLPRPIAWVLSENQDSSLNLAPFSFFNAICSDPPLMMMSVGIQPHGGSKDTLVNIEAREEFVVHIASVDQLPLLNETSATLPYGTSEVTVNDIDLTEENGFSLPRITDCKIAMACDKHHIQTIGNRGQSLIFGRIKQLYLEDECTEVMDNDRLKIHADRVQPLARLGASEYASFGQVLRIKRPD